MGSVFGLEISGIRQRVGGYLSLVCEHLMGCRFSDHQWDGWCQGRSKIQSTFIFKSLWRPVSETLHASGFIHTRSPSPVATFVRQWGSIWATSRYWKLSRGSVSRSFLLSSSQFLFLLRHLLAFAILNFQVTTHQWWSRTRQSCIRRDMRCFVPVWVDICRVNNDVGVSCGILTDEVLTRLLKLESDCK